MASEELTVSDVREQAVSIGKDIEAVVDQYGSRIVESVMPKLITLLDKMENLVVKRNEERSTITALLLERDDLMIQRDANERKKREVERELERAEYLVKSSERKLNGDVKFLKDGNKRMSKDLKKKKKQIKKIHLGKEQSFIAWLLDKALFGGKIYFLTKEFPRDATRISNRGSLSDTIAAQKREINRLSSEIETQKKQKSRIAQNITRRSTYTDESLNSETLERASLGNNSMDRLSANGYSEKECTRKKVIRYSYAKMHLDNETSRNGSTTETFSKPTYTNDYLDNDTSENGSKKLTRLPYTNRYPDSTELKSERVTEKLSPYLSDANEDADGEMLDEKCKTRGMKHNNYQVTVDIHSNRKDFKKLSVKGIEIEEGNPEYHPSDISVGKMKSLLTSPSNYEHGELLSEGYLNNPVGDVNLERFACGSVKGSPESLSPRCYDKKRLSVPFCDKFYPTDSESSTSELIDEYRYLNCPSGTSSVAESESVISGELPDKPRILVTCASECK